MSIDEYMYACLKDHRYGNQLLVRPQNAVCMANLSYDAFGKFQLFGVQLVGLHERAFDLLFVYAMQHARCHLRPLHDTLNTRQAEAVTICLRPSSLC